MPLTFCVYLYVAYFFNYFLNYYFKAVKRFESLKAVCKVPTNIINISELLWLGLALELGAR